MPRGFAHLALYFLSIEQVDENLEPAHVTDRELTRLLAQVKVPHRAQGDDRGGLVTALYTSNVPYDNSEYNSFDILFII